VHICVKRVMPPLFWVTIQQQLLLFYEFICIYVVTYAHS